MTAGYKAAFYFVVGIVAVALLFEASPVKMKGYKRVGPGRSG